MRIIDMRCPAMLAGRRVVESEVPVMPVQLGARAEHGFDEPLGLLSDCHRRIEQFLATLQRVIDEARTAELSEQHRRAVETALNYFRTGAPRHTQDEECSLFPLLRASEQPQARKALEVLSALEHDHDDADAAHAEVEKWFRRWLETGALGAPQRRWLEEVLVALRQMYRRHIDVEEKQIFPMAAQVLSSEQLARVGREMADRRGLTQPATPDRA